MDPLTTPDGRYLIVRGRLWRGLRVVGCGLKRFHDCVRDAIEMARNKPIDFPVLLVEADTTGVTRDDPIIHFMCVLVEKGEDGEAHPAAGYTGYQEVDKPSSEGAFKAHGIPDERLKARGST